MIYMKAQLELSVLTKIAMLFFIISLSLIAYGISNTEKSALCGEQASATARIIASNINQVLNAPVEDARVVYKFEPTIPVSKEKFGERYEVWLAETEQTGTSGGGAVVDNRVQLSVIVKPLTDLSCARTAPLFYDKTKVQLEFVKNAAPNTPEPKTGWENGVVVLTPSDRDNDLRSKFLVIVKCKQRVAGGMSFIYFDDCKNGDANACSPLEPLASNLDQCES